MYLGFSSLHALVGMEERILQQLETLTSRLAALEVKVENSSEKNQSDPDIPPNGQTTSGENGPPLDGQAILAPAPATAQEVQQEFTSIKQSLSSTRLPPELTVNTDRAGIPRSEQPVANLIAKTARYAETILKLLQSPERPTSEIFTVTLALVQLLQEEQAALVVQASFDPTVSRFFRTLQRGQGFSPEALNHLRTAASIASVYRGPRVSQGSASRGRGQNAYNQWSNNNRRPDFPNFNRGRFPRARGGRGASQFQGRTPENPED